MTDSATPLVCRYKPALLIDEARRNPRLIIQLFNLAAVSVPVKLSISVDKTMSLELDEAWVGGV